jgi:hypothetical protein
MARIFIVGNVGTDAGGWFIDENGVIHRVPGWDPEAALEIQHAVNIIREAAQLKTPGLAEAATKAAGSFVHQEVTGLLGEDGVAVFG